MNEQVLRVKIDNIVLGIGQVSEEQKLLFQAAIDEVLLSPYDEAAGIILAYLLQNSLRYVEGARDSEGNPFVLRFAQGKPNIECIYDMLMWGTEIKEKIFQVLCENLYATPEKFTDQNGKELSGVEILSRNSNVLN